MNGLMFVCSKCPSVINSDTTQNIHFTRWLDSILTLFLFFFKFLGFYSQKRHSNQVAVYSIWFRLWFFRLFSDVSLFFLFKIVTLKQIWLLFCRPNQQSNLMAWTYQKNANTHQILLHNHRTINATKPARQKNKHNP